ncbi:MAG: peptide deformylase [Micromonosporaceae bacterium]
MTDPDRAADAFADVLARWRAERGLTKKQLAAEMGFDPSYVSHVEARRHRPTEDFARRAEQVLQADGAIWRGFREFEDARQVAVGARHRDGAEPRPTSPAGPGGLVVEHETALLSYVDGGYRCSVRRELHNIGSDPITRYLVHISVNRYPGEPERSNRHYRDHPLTVTELNLAATCAGEPMLWRVKHDRDADKEVWLLFENDQARFPLYPGQRVAIEYAYTVGEDKWGQFFQRAVRLPTRRLSVRLDFPAELEPAVWGVESSLTAEAVALRSPLRQRQADGRAIFEWSTDDPPLEARYRLEWRFRVASSTPVARAGGGGRPSESMRAAGIVQRGAPMLERPARWFDLPEQEALARDVVSRLLDTLDRVAHQHGFGKGVGLAAPQIGIGWAATVIQPAGDGEPIVLLNPRVVGESVDQDEQYEGCLSFFDVRGRVARPLLIEVEHADLTGARQTTTYERALARLVAHEIDHLGGLLYADRMASGERLVPVEEYAEHGQPWVY